MLCRLTLLLALAVAELVLRVCDRCFDSRSKSADCVIFVILGSVWHRLILIMFL
jgi:hypothetical protein